MKSMELTVDERIQFSYILPAQGNIFTLETVESILNKVKIHDQEEAAEKDAVKIEFECEEIELMRRSILILNESERLSFSSLSLAKKILRSEIK